MGRAVCIIECASEYARWIGKVVKSFGIVRVIN